MVQNKIHKMCPGLKEAYLDPTASIAIRRIFRLIWSMKDYGLYPFQYFELLSQNYIFPFFTLILNRFQLPVPIPVL